MTPERLEELKNKLLEPENSDYLNRAIEMMPAQIISDVYIKYFPKFPVVGLRLIGAKLGKLADVRSVHVLEALDKIREKEPKLLKNYAQVWVDTHNSILDNLETDQAIDENISSAVLEIAHFLIGKESSELWSGRLAIQAKQITELEQNLRAEKQRTAQLERELEQFKRKLEQAESVTQKQLALQKTRLEQSQATQQQQAVRLEQQKQQEESKKLRAEIAQLKEQLAREQQETVSSQAKLLDVTNTLSAKVKRVEGQLEPLQQANQRLTADVLEKSQALSEAETIRTQLRQRNNDLNHELEKARAEQKKLAREYAMRQREQQESINGTRLENALMIDYRHLSYEPAQRLIRLSEIYKAFLEDNQSQLLQTNYSDFSDPKNQIRGVLMLGLEQLLLDLVNLPLVAFLNSQTIRQESVLKQLLGILESPRYRGIK